MDEATENFVFLAVLWTPLSVEAVALVFKLSDSVTVHQLSRNNSLNVCIGLACCKHKTLVLIIYFET